MKKSWLALALVGILIALAGIITLAIVRSNSPLHYVTDTFGVKIPSTVKINSFRTQPDWDGRLSYGILNAHKGSSTGLVNTANFTPLKNTSDTRVSQLVKDVNTAFHISDAQPESSHILYQKITIKDESLLVIFYDSVAEKYFFYGTRY
ncbi:hypothetical protein [Alloscardovia omnicolens]|uniref:hypothetical protein n=1 Tax=Alloscardovia omnicolens TaxID=419015 RepID=UPI002889AD12|nr:hypothetical protein [Alloscardovia omnicolens]